MNSSQSWDCSHATRANLSDWSRQLVLLSSWLQAKSERGKAVSLQKDSGNKELSFKTSYYKL